MQRHPPPLALILVRSAGWRRGSRLGGRAPHRISCPASSLSLGTGAHANGPNGATHRGPTHCAHPRLSQPPRSSPARPRRPPPMPANGRAQWTRPHPAGSSSATRTRRCGGRVRRGRCASSSGSGRRRARAPTSSARSVTWSSGPTARSTCETRRPQRSACSAATGRTCERSAGEAVAPANSRTPPGWRSMRTARSGSWTGGTGATAASTRTPARS
jgi:hypothetical protein